MQAIAKFEKVSLDQFKETGIPQYQNVYENIKARVIDDIRKVDNVDTANISFVDGKEKFKNYILCLH